MKIKKPAITSDFAQPAKSIFYDFVRDRTRQDGADIGPLLGQLFESSFLTLPLIGQSSIQPTLDRIPTFVHPALNNSDLIQLLTFALTPRGLLACGRN
jgi:hypothetical protein